MQKTKNYSMKKVAQLAGVSVATVSRILNHRGGYSEETRDLVINVARHLGYLPEPARWLPEEKRPVIGILVPDITNEYFANIVLELQNSLFVQGFLVTVCNVNESEELTRQYVAALLAQEISALVFVCGLGSDISVPDVPVLYIDRHPHSRGQDVIIIESDNNNGGYQATRELIRCQCKNIAFLTDSLDMSSKQSRYQGYLRALQKADLPAEPSLFICAGKSEIEAGKQAIMDFLAAEPELDGIMCTTDHLAAGAILGLKEFGIRVPEDVKVTGYDDLSIAEFFYPSITSIRQDTKRMAQKATELLMELLKERPVEKRQVIIPISLSCRNSTRP